MARLNEAAARIRAANPLGKEYSEALARGLAVLTSFDGAQGGLTLSDVANRIGVPRATARRALLTLVALGYAQEHNRVFRLTPRVLRIASAYLNCNVATAVLQPHCEALAAQHAAIFSVAALDDGDAVMIAYATARRLYAQGAGIGLRVPAYCSAVGRVLLAGLEDDAIEIYLKALRPSAVTPRTIVDVARIGRAIQTARRQGHALVREEAELGFCSLAVPVRGRDGRVRFALNVGSHVREDKTNDLTTRYLDILSKSAEDLGQQLL